MTKQRNAVAEALRQASKDNGPDSQTNPRLADAVAKAKRIGFPKSSIESAIARGQGVPPSGVAFENVTVEAILPPSAAVIISCQTDSKLRTLADLRLAIKDYGGTATPTNHLFERKGRITFERSRDVEEIELFDRAIEAGATDVEITDEGTVVVFTEPSQTAPVACLLASLLGFKVRSSDIIWNPKEDMMVDVPSKAYATFVGFLANCSDPIERS